MKPNSFFPAIIAMSKPQSHFSKSFLWALALASLTIQVEAADITWSGGTIGGGQAWRSTANWSGGVVPTSADNAIFDSAGTATIITIDFGAAAGVQQVGSITVGSGRTSNLSIRSLATSSTNGTLLLNGVGGVLLSNNSAITLTFTNASTGTNLALGLGASGTIFCGGNAPVTSGTIQIYSTITEVGGQRSITKTGGGQLYLRGTNSYTGTTTVSQGDLQVDDVGTIGIGTNTLFLSGGNLQSGASRSGTSASAQPLANPIVITTDAYIQNRAGTATNRFFALSGTLSGSAGTLKIANPTTTPGNTFAVRLFNNSINFSRPMIVGEFGYDLNSAFTVMELANTNGTQTFSGDISGVGSIRRLNPFSASTPAGTTIFSGNNTYSGGTTISSGTMLANNTVGSGLGSGTVIVTNVGILGGNGSITASTIIMSGGTISPGSAGTNFGSLAVSDLNLTTNANYLWQVGAVPASGTAGVNWDVITCSSAWSDTATAAMPITIKVDSRGTTPTGWNPATAQTWTLISSGTANGFDVSHFSLDTTAFTASAPGIFALSVSGGSLQLTYTPASDIIINVASGSVDQGGTSPTPYPILTGEVGVQKVGNGEVVFTNSANNYQGTTKIYAGTLSLATDANNGSGAFGTGTTAAQLGFTAGNSNATLNINTPGVTLGRAVQVLAGSTGIKTIGTTISSGTANFLGDFTLADSVTLTAAAGGSAIFSGNITGSGGLSLTGAGSITLGAPNSYSGPTTLSAASVNLNASAIGSNTLTIASATTLDNTSGSSVTLNNNPPQNWNANFTFTGSTNLNLGSGSVTINTSRALTVNGSTLTVGGSIAGPGGLTKLGAGTLAFTASTNSLYTGPTTNAAGTIAINGSATFGDGSSPLYLSGGNILSTGTRSGFPLTNNVVMSADTTLYGNSTATAPSSRILPFAGNWTTLAGTLRVGNTGSASNSFFMRMLAGSNMSGPIIVGDPAFDTPGAISVLQFYQDSNAPVQTVSSVISGSGQVWRGQLGVGAGGTTILSGNSTFSGGMIFNSGTLGIGLNSTPTSGTVTSGPLGIGTFEIQNDPAINIFASGGARTLANNVFLNGVTNVTFTGTNALTFNGGVNIGTVSKTITVNSTAPVTFSGAMTNVAALTKAGTGRLIITGDNSTRTNATAVSAGTLLVNNTSGSGTGAGVVNVNSGGTLGGTGLIGGTLTVNAGGTLAPGNLAIGTITITNGLNLAGNVAIEVNTSASPSNDIVAVTGVLTNFSGSTLTVANLGPALAVGNKFTIFTQPVLNGDALTVSGGGVTWSNRLAVDGSIVVIPTPVSSAPSFAAGGVSVSGGGVVSLTATGALGGTFKLWASTNLAATPVTNTWTLLQSGTISSNPFTILDNSATNFPRRFYLFTAP